MPDPVFTGVAAAIVTFFDEHGSVDAASTARHASHLAGVESMRSWSPAPRAKRPICR